MVKKFNWKIALMAGVVTAALFTQSVAVYAETPTDGTTPVEESTSTEGTSEDGTAAGENTEPEQTGEEETPVEPEIHTVPMVVSVRSAYLYTEPSLASAMVAVPYREIVEMTDSYLLTQEGQWVVVYYNENTYYMLLNKVQENLASSLPEPAFRGNNPYQQKLMDVLKDIVENWKTCYGHNSSNGIPDENGIYTFDCSGLAAYAANKAVQPFIPVYRLSTSIINLYTADTLYNDGYDSTMKATTVCEGTLEESKLEPGDVLFFNLYTEEDGTQSAKGYNHCGIYIGNGEMVHSSHSFDGKVRIMPISGIYEKNFVLARRYLPTGAEAVNERYYTILTGTKIYTEKSTASKVKAVLPIESPVDVMFFGTGKWVYVKTGTGVCGFAMKKNLCKDFKEQNIVCYVRKASLKLCRNFTTKKDYFTIGKGTALRYVGRVGASNFYEVSYNGQNYYIYSKNDIKEKVSTGVVYP